MAWGWTLKVLLLAAALSPPSVDAQSIRTFAGNGFARFGGDGGQATDASLRSPFDVVFDAAGNAYIADADNNRIRKVTPAGVISTFAGGGSGGLGDGGPATLAMLNKPRSLAMDPAGNLYIGDDENYRIRKVDTAGIITTFAGDGTVNFGGEGVAATATGMLPVEIQFDPTGRLLFYDAVNHRVRRIGLDGKVTTVAGNGTSGYSGESGASALQAQLDYVAGIAFDASGNIYLADAGNNRLRKVVNGLISTIAGVTQPTPSGEGVLAFGSGLSRPSAVAIDADGVIYISENQASRIRKITTDGRIYTVAGTGQPGFSADGGPANASQLDSPGSIFIRGSELYVADTSNHRIRRIFYPVPSAPSSVFATASNAGATVTIAAPSFTGNAPILGYTVSSQPTGGIDTQAGTPTVSHVITGLTNGTSYTFTATATNAGGTGPASLASNAVTPLNFPGPPTITSVTVGPGRAGVSFTPPNDEGGTPITGYTVTSIPAGGLDASAGSTSLSHAVNGLVNGTSYVFTVRATNASGMGPASPTSEIVTPRSVPDAPPAPFATPQDHKVQLVLSAPSTDGGYPITNYVIATSPGGGIDEQAGTTALVRNITGLTNTVAYTFRVNASNSAGMSAFSPASAPVVPFGVPFAPQSPTAIAGSTRATVSFVAPASDGGRPVAGYRVVSEPAGGVDRNAASPSLNHVIENLANGTAYTFTVIATNAGGPGPASVPTAAVTPANGLPGAPTMGGGSAANAGAMVYFTPPEDTGGTPITGYAVTSSPAGGIDTQANTTALTHRIMGLTNGVAYTFTARATNAQGTGPTSAISTAVTPSASASVPTISIEGVQVNEGNAGPTVAQFVVRLSQPASTIVTFNLATANLSAASGSDYTAKSQSGLSIATGATTTTFSVNVIGDTVLETDERFVVNLSNVSGATIGNSQAIGVIASDDSIAPTITTVAGNGTAQFLGEGSATSVAIGRPLSTIVDVAGNLYIAEAGNNRIRKVDAAMNTSTFAGSATWGSSGNGGPATSAQLSEPTDLVRDAAGNLYFTDRNNNCVRKVGTDGIIIAVAGTCGAPGGFNLDNIAGTGALLDRPAGLAIDPAGNLYIADSGNSRIRKLATNGLITTVAGGGLTFDANRYAGDGGPAGLARLNKAEGVALDSLGNLYIADTQNHRIRQVGIDGVIRTIGGTGVAGLSGDGAAANLATFQFPTAVSVDLDDTLYVTEYWNHSVRRIADGIVSRLAGPGTGASGFAGDGGPASNAIFQGPRGLGISPTGNFYVADSGNARIRKITMPTPKAPRFPVAVSGVGSASVTFQPPLVSMLPITGYLVTSHPAGGIDTQAGVTATTHLMTGLSPAVSYTFTVTATSAGGVSLPSKQSNLTITYSPDLPSLSIADASVIEGNSGQRNMSFTVVLSEPSSQPITFNLATEAVTATSGSDYLAVSQLGLVIAPGQTALVVNVPVLGDVTPEPHETFALVLEAVNGANVLTPRPIGTILNDEAVVATMTTVAGGKYYNQVSGDGGFAVDAGLGNPAGMALDLSGNLLIASQSCCIRRVNGAGIISTIIGNPLFSGGGIGDNGPAIGAYLKPYGLAVDSAGNVNISEPNDSRVRIVNNGIIQTRRTVFPNGAGALSLPVGMVLDSADNLYVSDMGRWSVVKFTSAGVASVVVGTGNNGANGPGTDGLPATAVSLGAVQSVAIGIDDTLYIAELNNARISKVGPDGILHRIGGDGITRASGDGSPALSSSFAVPTGIAVDTDGVVYIAEQNNYRIRRIDKNGILGTVAGWGQVFDQGADGGPALQGGLADPGSLLFDPRGFLYVFDNNAGRIRRIALGIPSAASAPSAAPANGSAQVVIKPPASDGGSAVTAYTVVSIPAGGVDIHAGTLNSLHVVAGLQNGVSYRFRVRAVNANGASVSTASTAIVPSGAAPRLSIVPAAISEGNSGFAPMVFTASLSTIAPEPGVTFSVHVRGAASTGVFATPGIDFVAGDRTNLRIEAGQSQASFSVKIIGDTRVEPNEVFEVALFDIAGADAGTTLATATIIDDDTNAASLQSLPMSVAITTAAQITTTAPSVPPSILQDNQSYLRISDIQGNGPVSIHLGQMVRVRGIVVAQRTNGFYLQSEDADRDGDPATSEGVFVAWPGTRTVMAVGDRADVQGRVEEVRHGARLDQFFVTQIAAQHVERRGRGSLPTPTKLPLDRKMSLGWLERFEGMRVTSPPLRVVAPVSGKIDEANATARIDGVFHAVAIGVKRPFREVGGAPLMANMSVAGALPVMFDGNPERIRIDSAGLLGAQALAVDAGDTLPALTGVLDYADASYTLLPEPQARPQVTAGSGMRVVTTARADEFTLASVNLRHLFDDRKDTAVRQRLASATAYALRLAKAANAICAAAKAPDVVGVFGVESLAVLQDLADAINGNDGNVLFPDSCQDSPGYRAYLPAPAGTANEAFGFLVRSLPAKSAARMQVISVAQITSTATFGNLEGRSDAPTAQSPLLLRLKVSAAKEGATDELSVLMSRFDPPGKESEESPGASGAKKHGEHLRLRRTAQATQLAAWLQARQTRYPTEQLVVLGNFEANEFSDGRDDLLAVVTGRSESPEDGLANQASPSDRPLTNLTWSLPAAARYSQVVDGDAQVRDHVLVNQPVLDRYAPRIEIARVNADFGEDNFDDFSVPLRWSDRDPEVLYLRLPVLAQ